MPLILVAPSIEYSSVYYKVPFSMKSKATPTEWPISILNGNAVMNQMPPSFGRGPYI